MHTAAGDVVQARSAKSVANRELGCAEAYLQQTGIGDTIYVGPEAEFFVFDDVRFDVSQNQTFYALNEEIGRYISMPQNIMYKKVNEF